MRSSALAFSILACMATGCAMELDPAIEAGAADAGSDRGEIEGSGVSSTAGGCDEYWPAPRRESRNRSRTSRRSPKAAALARSR